MALELFQHAIQIVKRLGYGKIVLFQQIFAEDQSTIVERHIKESRHVIPFAVFEFQQIDIVLQAELFDSSIEVRGPLRIIADRHDRSVERKGRVFTLR